MKCWRICPFYLAHIGPILSILNPFSAEDMNLKCGIPLYTEKMRIKDGQIPSDSTVHRLQISLQLGILKLLKNENALTLSIDIPPAFPSITVLLPDSPFAMMDTDLSPFGLCEL